MPGLRLIPMKLNIKKLYSVTQNLLIKKVLELDEKINQKKPKLKKPLKIKIMML